MSKATSHSASSTSDAPYTTPPARGATKTPPSQHHGARMATSSTGAAGRRRIKRVISSRSAAMVMTRKANHHGSVAALSCPVANDRLPATQASALTSSNQVCDGRLAPHDHDVHAGENERCDDHQPGARIVPAGQQAHARPAPTPAAPGMPRGNFTATARSRPITVPEEAADHQCRVGQTGLSQPGRVVGGRDHHPDPQQAAGNAREQREGHQHQEQRSRRHGRG